MNGIVIIMPQRQPQQRQPWHVTTWVRTIIIQTGHWVTSVVTSLVRLPHIVIAHRLASIVLFTNPVIVQIP